MAITVDKLLSMWGILIGLVCLLIGYPPVESIFNLEKELMDTEARNRTESQSLKLLNLDIRRADVGLFVDLVFYVSNDVFL